VVCKEIESGLINNYPDQQLPRSTTTTSPGSNVGAVSALDVIAGWPVPNAAAAVVGPSGVMAEYGDVMRPFRLASVTKPLTARAAQVAVEEGAVELDTPAGPPGATVRHLLAHTAGYGVTSTVADLVRFAGDLLRPATVSAQLHAEATSVQFPGLDGVLPGFGVQRPNDWGLGFELRDGKSPHWTGSTNSARTYGHFGQSGTFLWVDPQVDLALVVLTDRDFGDWAYAPWPALSDEVLREFGAD
jgi:CubicO group peptidase (beta-lactamase class C family)